MAVPSCDAQIEDLVRDRRRIVIDLIPERGRHVYYPPDGGELTPGTPCACGRERWNESAAPPPGRDAPPDR